MDSERIRCHANGVTSEVASELQKINFFLAWKIPRTLVWDNSRAFGAGRFKWRG